LFTKDITDLTYIYAWQDPTKDPDYRVGTFFTDKEQ